MEVEPALTMQLTADHTSGYLIYFREKPDLSAAYAMDWKARGRYVVNHLQATAEHSQTRVKVYLEKQGIPCQSYWIDNVIVVGGSDRAVFTGLLQFTEIEILRARRHPILYEPEKFSANPLAVTTIETNISRIGADQVWAMGIDGSGIVVANIDTGVRYTHEALVNQYRGNLGGGSFDHNYNWWDPALGGQNLVPDDWHNHGSHTMGIMLGDDGGDNQIGMAPGAAWIACQAFESDDSELLECGQFMAAPWDLTQQNANPDLRPHIVNNSWGDCLRYVDHWYDGIINNWHALGIYPVFSNGNASNCSYSQPPGLNTVGNPARMGNVTAVGSTNRDDGTYAVHSNWGPTDDADTINPRGFPDMKPQVVAPGYNIRSAIKSSDTSYQNWAGTSMAAPHVSGLVALMWSAASCLTGNYAATETILEETANPIYYNDGSAATPANHPNYATGWGEINAYEAVRAALKYCGSYRVTAEPASQAACIASVDAVSYDLSVDLLGIQSDPVTLSTQGQPAKSFVDFSANPVLPPAASTLTISNLSGEIPDSYGIDVIGVSPTEIHTTTISLDLYSQVPSLVTLMAPSNESLDQPQRPVFEWESAAQAGSYRIEIAADPDFSNLVISQTVTGNTYIPAVDLATATVYYWRVKAENACGEGHISAFWSFVTAPAPGDCALGATRQVLYREDFEAGAAGWSSGGISSTWRITNTRTYSGSYAYHATDLPGISDQHLTSPEIGLPSARGNALTLQYWNWQFIEPSGSACYDGGILEISSDGGSTWSQLQNDVFQTTPYDGIVSSNFHNPLAGLNAWCGASQGWVASVVDLEAYAGQTVQFRYRLGTDTSAGREGWYLDALRVQRCVLEYEFYLPLIKR